MKKSIKKRAIFEADDAAERFFVSSKVRKGELRFRATVEATEARGRSRQSSTSSLFKTSQVERGLKTDFSVAPVAFVKLVHRRRTSKTFAAGAISFDQLSALLLLSCGPSPKKVTGWNGKRSDGRVYPSAGATHSLEFYLCVRNIAGLEAGLYYFNVRKKRIRLLKSGGVLDRPREFWAQYDQFKNASAIIFATSVFQRCRKKYGERSLRYVFLEAGAVGMIMNLSAEALEIGFNYDGGGYDEEIESLIGVDGVTEGLVSMYVIGRKPATRS